MSRKKSASDIERAVAVENRSMLGTNLTFTVKEAYKQLRTNLEFALSNVERCPIVGLTSSIRSEGKSLTSINIAHTIAETGKKVLLVEGDLRLPSLSRKLMLKKRSGLSDVLVGKLTLDKAICEYTTAPDIKESPAFHIITAGSIPPNPSELLCSERMKALLDELRATYDFIVLDLPPVNIVTDALGVSKYLDGMLVLVRQDHTIQGDIAETIRQLTFAGVRILGFVFNAASDGGNAYVRRYKYRYRRYRNYNKYGYGYGYGYDRSHSNSTDVSTPSKEE